MELTRLTIEYLKRLKNDPLGLNQVKELEQEQLILTKEQKKKYKNQFIRSMGNVLITLTILTGGVVTLIKNIFTGEIDIFIGASLIMVFTNTLYQILKEHSYEVDHIPERIEKAQKKQKRKQRNPTEE